MDTHIEVNILKSTMFHWQRNRCIPWGLAYQNR